MKATLSLILLCIGLILTGQPNYELKTYNLKTGEKDKYYAKRAKDFAKANRMNRALYHAAFGLSISDSKGVISDVQEILRNYYQITINNNLQEIENLKRTTETFQNDRTVADKAKILNLYRIMDMTNDVLATIPPSKFKGAKKKDPGVTLTVEDFGDALAEAQASFDQSIEDAAKWHYDQGRELQAQGVEGNKDNAKAAAVSYKFAQAYVSDYRDAGDRYEVCRKLGTTRLGLTEIKNMGDEYGNIGGSVANELLSMLISNQGRFEFFEVVDRESMGAILDEQKLALSGLMDETTTADLGGLHGVDALLIGEVVKGSVQREEGDGGKREHEKKVKTGTKTVTKDDGSTKEENVYEKVKGYSHWRWKKQMATVKVSFKIVEVATGKVVMIDDAGETDNWEEEWMYRTSGDKRAVPDYTTAEPSFPGVDTQIQRAARGAASKMYGHISQYAASVSR